MPGTGLEPARIAPRRSERRLYTNFNTPATNLSRMYTNLPAGRQVSTPRLYLPLILPIICVVDRFEYFSPPHSTTSGFNRFNS